MKYVWLIAVVLIGIIGLTGFASAPRYVKVAFLVTNQKISDPTISQTLWRGEDQYTERVYIELLGVRKPFVRVTLQGTGQNYTWFKYAELTGKIVCYLQVPRGNYVTNIEIGFSQGYPRVFTATDSWTTQFSVI
jgi:hypothetical protein